MTSWRYLKIRAARARNQRWSHHFFSIILVCNDIYTKEHFTIFNGEGACFQSKYQMSTSSFLSISHNIIRYILVHTSTSCTLFKILILKLKQLKLTLAAFGSCLPSNLVTDILQSTPRNCTVKSTEKIFVFYPRRYYHGVLWVGRSRR